MSDDTNHDENPAKALRQLLMCKPDIDDVRRLLASCNSPDVVNGLVKGMTAPYYSIHTIGRAGEDLAVAALHKRIVLLLISHPGYNPAVECLFYGGNQNIISKAVSLGDLELVQALVEVNEGVDASHLRQPFVGACEGGLTDIADYLLAAGAREPSLTLHQAIQSNSLKVCESVSPQELLKINQTNRDGFTPLEVAAKKSYCVLRFILSVNGRSSCNSDQPSPLIAAVKGGYEANVKMLIDHNCDVNEANKFGEIALHAAASNGAHNLICILMAGGADINLQDSYGHTALMKVKRGDVPTLEALLSYPACDANIVDQQGLLAINSHLCQRMWGPNASTCCSLLLDRMMSNRPLSEDVTESLMTTAIILECEPLISLMLYRGCPPHVMQKSEFFTNFFGSRVSNGLKGLKGSHSIFAFLATRNRPEDQELLSLFIEKGVAESEPAEACLFCIRGAIFQTSKTFALSNFKELLAKHRTALELRIDGIRVIDRLLMNTLQDSRRVKSADIVSDLCDFGADASSSSLGLYLHRQDAELEVVEALINNGLNILINGKQFFKAALGVQRPDICMLLIDHGLDVPTPLLIVASALATSLHAITKRGGNLAIAGYLALATKIINKSTKLDFQLQLSMGHQECPAMNRLILEHGVSVNEMPLTLEENEGDMWYRRSDNQSKKYPLSRLCEVPCTTKFVHRQRLRIIKAALDAGMDVDGGSDSDELTPLMVAVNRRWYELAWLLMANGADTTRTHNGVTAYELVVNHHKQNPNSRRIAKLLAPHLCMDDISTGAPETDDEENEVGENNELYESDDTDTETEWWSDHNWDEENDYIFGREDDDYDGQHE